MASDEGAGASGGSPNRRTPNAFRRHSPSNHPISNAEPAEKAVSIAGPRKRKKERELKGREDEGDRPPCSPERKMLAVPFAAFCFPSENVGVAYTASFMAARVAWISAQVGWSQLPSCRADRHSLLVHALGAFAEDSGCQLGQDRFCFGTGRMVTGSAASHQPTPRLKRRKS